MTPPTRQARVRSGWSRLVVVSWTRHRDVILLAARSLLAMMFGANAIDKFRLDRLEMEQIAALHLPAPALLERFTGTSFEGGARHTHRQAQHLCRQLCRNRRT